MELIALIGAISGETLLHAVVWLVICAVIYFVVQWGLNQAAIPEPFNRVARVLLVLIVVILLVNTLLSLIGRGFIRF